MRSTTEPTSAEKAFADAGLHRCQRRAAAHFVRLAYRAERRSPSNSFGTRAKHLNAAVSALGVGLAVASGYGFSNADRSVVFGAVPARRAQMAAVGGIVIFGGALGATMAAALFGFGALVIDVSTGLWAAAWMIACMSVLIVMAAVLETALPPARMRRRLVRAYFDAITAGADQPVTAYFLEAFAASGNAPLLSLFRSLNVVADEHRIGLLAVAGNEKRLGVYTGRAGRFHVVFDDGLAAVGNAPRRWYLARYPGAIAS